MRVSWFRVLFTFFLIGAVAATAVLIWGQELLEAPSTDSLSNNEDSVDLTNASTRDETGRGTISYVLDKTRWTTFALPGRVDSLRLLSHPDVAGDHNPVAGATFRYGFEVEVLSEDGSLIRRKRQFFRTELVTYRDAVGGAQVTARRYSDDPSLPLAVDRLILMLDDLPEARQIRVRHYFADPALTAINLRVYRPRPYNEGNVSALWERLPLSEKRALSLGYVYPPDLLTQAERQSILSQRWQPFGPVGIEGRDYISRRLEIYDAPGNRVVQAKTTLEDGIFLDAGRRAGVLLPEQFEELQITASRPDALLGNTGFRGSPIDLKVEIEKPFSRTLAIREIRTDIAGEARLEPFDAVRLILSAEEPVWLRVAARLKDEKTRVLTAEIPRTPYRVTSAGLPLTIETAPNMGAEVPLRLDLRLLGEGPREVRLHMLNTEGASVAEDVVTLTASPSIYDRAVDTPETPLSEVRTVYMLLSPDVAKVEIASEAQVLVASYMRPVGLARMIDVPEDYFARSKMDSDNRSWFGVIASKTDNAAAREIVVERPYRASESDTLVDPDALDWEDFTIEGDWVARRALIPRGVGGLSERARRIFFQPVPLGHELPLLNAAEGFAPELFLPREAAPGRYTALVDGVTVWEAQLSGNLRVSLPPLPPDAQHLELRGPGHIQPLLSGLDLDRDGFIERRLLRLSPGTSKFSINKRSSGREVLAIRIFPLESTDRRAIIRSELNLRPPLNTVLDSWSDRSRRFSIRMRGPGAQGLLQQSGDMLGAEKRMFMVLGEEIPKGQYQMTMTLEYDSEVLLLVSRAAPALKGQLEFGYEEPEVVE